MSIKILQVTAAYKPAHIYGGPTMSVAKLCEVLTENGVEVEVLTTTANGKTELNVIPNDSTFVDGVKVTYCKRLTKDHTHFSPALLWALRSEILNSRKIHNKFAQNEKSLIIHIHAWWNLVSIFSCAIAKCYHIPVILSPRGMLTTYTSTNRNSIAKQIIHQILGKKLLKYCHIHVTSEKEKRDVSSIITAKSITVISNLVELESQQEVNNEQEGLTSIKTVKAPFKLIFLSRIEEKKGLDLLLESLSSLPFKWNLTIAGSGEDYYVRSLKLKAKSLKLEDSIHWVGHVKNEQKFKLLAEHNLMVLTSYNENFANVVIESLSVGTPVLISREVGLADFVEQKKLGWVTNLSSNNINEKIITAFESANLRNEIRAIGPKIISNEFEPKILFRRYLRLYSQIKNGKL